MAGSSMGDLFHSTPKPPTQNKVFMVVDYTEAQVTGILDEMNKEVKDADKNWAEWFQKRNSDKAEYRALKQEEKGRAKKEAKLQWKAEQEEVFPERHKIKSRLTVRGVAEEATAAAGSAEPAGKRQRTEMAASSRTEVPATASSVSSADGARSSAGAAAPQPAACAGAANESSGPLTAAKSSSMDLAGYASDGSSSDDSSSGGPFQKRRSTPAAAPSEEQVALDSQNAAVQKMQTAAAEAYRDSQSDNSSEENDSVALDGTHLFSSRPAAAGERPPGAPQIVTKSQVMSVGTPAKAPVFVPPAFSLTAAAALRMPTVVYPPVMPKRGVAALLASAISARNAMSMVPTLGSSGSTLGAAGLSSRNPGR